MSSLILSPVEYFGAVKQGLQPFRYRYRFLVEGDSWMDRSAAFSASLPNALAQRFDAAGKEVLIVKLAIFGDTMRRIGSLELKELSAWLNKGPFLNFDAVLLSAGGNDYIDAATDPAPGDGILNAFTVTSPPTSAAECVNAVALATLRNSYLNPNFLALLQCLRQSPLPNVPLYLNCYDTPVAREAPAFPGGHSWLAHAYNEHRIPHALWPGVTELIFTHLAETVTLWGQMGSNIHCVPTRKTLIPAKDQDPGSSGDWLNEIHPNASGWKKLADVWYNAI